MGYNTNTICSNTFVLLYDKLNRVSRCDGQDIVLPSKWS